MRERLRKILGLEIRSWQPKQVAALASLCVILGLGVGVVLREVTHEPAPPKQLPPALAVFKYPSKGRGALNDTLLLEMGPQARALFSTHLPGGQLWLRCFDRRGKEVLRQFFDWPGREQARSMEFTYAPNQIATVHLCRVEDPSGRLRVSGTVRQ